MELKPEDIVISEWSRGVQGGFILHRVAGVQIVHRPTGAMDQVDTERSQHKNKAIAMKMLQTKIEQIQCADCTEQGDDGLPVPFEEAVAKCCNFNCKQGRNCPLRKG